MSRLRLLTVASPVITPVVMPASSIVPSDARGTMPSLTLESTAFGRCTRSSLAGVVALPVVRRADSYSALTAGWQSLVCLSTAPRRLVGLPVDRKALTVRAAGKDQAGSCGTQVIDAAQPAVRQMKGVTRSIAMFAGQSERFGHEYPQHSLIPQVTKNTQGMQGMQSQVLNGTWNTQDPLRGVWFVRGRSA